MSVTPIIAAIASHLDQRSADEIVELDRKQDWPGLLGVARLRLQSEPGRAEWWFLQGYALTRQGQHADAVASYQRAVRISPEDEASWLALGGSQNELGQPDGAIQSFRQALRFRPESAPAYLALADTYQGQGRPDLAIAAYRECVRYDPASVQCWLGLATSYQITGQRERRDEALFGLRKLDPGAADLFEKQYQSK